MHINPFGVGAQLRLVLFSQSLPVTAIFVEADGGSQTPEPAVVDSLLRRMYLHITTMINRFNMHILRQPSPDISFVRPLSLRVHPHISLQSSPIKLFG